MLFFFKQKTAYEIPLCDWSSDVCSSDPSRRRHTRYRYVTGVQTCALPICGDRGAPQCSQRGVESPLGFIAIEAGWTVTEVGRQPWVVYNILRTADAVTPMPGLIVPFLTFTAQVAPG